MNALAVRPEYEVLARDFRSLAAQFDLEVGAPLEEELVLLCACFEAIDRHVDETPGVEQRAALGGEVLRALESPVADGSPLPDELRSLLDALRAVLVRRTATKPFVTALERFLRSSEVLRSTRAGGVFVRCVLEEARRAAEMALLVVDQLRTAAFDRFFLVLSEVANLVDKLHDVRGDRRRGEISVDVGLVLHVRLATAFAIRGLQLLWLSPRPLRFLKWSARYLRPPGAPQSPH